MKKSNGRATVFGSFAVDLMSRTMHLPQPGETIKSGFFRMGPGGKGFNQGIAAKKLGGNIELVTKVGRDQFSGIAREEMLRVGLSTQYLFESDSADTGVALIMVSEASGQNIITIVPGACATIGPEDIEKIGEIVRNSDYLLLQLEVNQDANEAVARLAKENGVKVIVNTAPFQPMSLEFLRGLYLITPNEVEAKALTGINVTDLESADQAARIVLNYGVKNVIITMGDKGAYLNNGTRSAIIPGYKVNVVDTTGAGDAFNGALLTALLEGKNLFEAVQFANAVAACSVQFMGTSIAMPTREEVDRFLDFYSTKNRE